MEMIGATLAVHSVAVRSINKFFKGKAFLVRLAAVNQILLSVLLKGVESALAAIN